MISVIIPSYKDQKIFACVQTLQQFEVELIIVDSSDKTFQQRLSTLPANVILLEEQTFPGAARNIGIQEASHEIIAFIDSDVIVGSGWYEAVINNVQPNTILTGPIHNGTPDNKIGSSVWAVEFSAHKGKEKKVVKAAPSCNMAMKKESFQPFKNIRAYEDMLFCKEFRGEVQFIPEMQVSHLNITDLQQAKNKFLMLGYYSSKIRREYNIGTDLIYKHWLIIIPLFFYRLSLIFWRTKSLSFPIISMLYSWSLGFKKGIDELKP